MSDCRFGVSPVNYPDPEPPFSGALSLVPGFIPFPLVADLFLFAMKEIS